MQSVIIKRGQGIEGRIDNDSIAIGCIGKQLGINSNAALRIHLVIVYVVLRQVLRCIFNVDDLGDGIVC